MTLAFSACHLVEVPAGTRLPRHEHASVSLAVVLSGGMLEGNRQHPVTLEPGTIRLAPPGRRQLTFPVDTQVAVFELDAEHVRVALGGIPSAPLLVERGRLALLGQQAGSAVLRNDNPVEVDCRLLEFLAQCRHGTRGRSRDSAPPPWLLSARDRLADEWHRPPTAAQLADHAGVHRVHFVRMFHAHFGVAPGEFVRRRKVGRAERLLSSTTLPLAQVAVLAGCTDQAHLTRLTRTYLHATPGEIRRRALTLHRYKHSAREP